MLLTDNQTITKAFNQRHPEVKPFQYLGHLLDLAQDLGNRLLRAFQPNGLAFGSVNLRRGVLRNVEIPMFLKCRKRRFPVWRESDRVYWSLLRFLR